MGTAARLAEPQVRPNGVVGLLDNAAAMLTVARETARRCTP